MSGKCGYKLIRDYRHMDRYHLQALLHTSPLTKEAEISRDPEMIADLLTHSVVSALDTVAPTKRIQLSKKEFDFRQPETKLLIIERNSAQRLAHETNLPEDWRCFRAVRNRVRRMIVIRINDRKYH